MDNDRRLPPFPLGWFAVAFGHEAPPGAVRARRFMGHELVLFRTASGQPCLMDAYCPHLGAHFASGGTIEGETIRCPFHGFRFDCQGSCVATGYGTKPPPSARARTWPIREVNGLILAFHGADGDAPAWEVPALDLDGWTAPLTRTFRLRTHPQETTENGVDLGHLSWVHGYQQVEVLDAFATDGPRLRVRYAMSRSAGALGRFGEQLRAEFAITAYGLGYSLVEVSVPVYGLHTRHLVCATPTDPGRTTMRVAMFLHTATQPARINPALRFLPRPVVDALIARLTFNGFVHDLEQDFPLWERKRYIKPPLLAAGDGPIGKYRTWTRQFYPQSVPLLEDEPQQMTE